MSNNPFETPVFQGASGNYNGSQVKAPTALTVILIIALILGILGTISGCFGAGGLAIGKFLVKTLEEDYAKNPTAEAEAQLKIQQLAQGSFVLNLSLVIGGLVLSAMMATGAIACLNRKSWGHSVLSISFLGAILFGLVRLVATSLSQLKMKDIMVEQFEQMSKNQGDNAPPVEGIMGAVFWGMIIFWGVWALIQISFYVWGFLYLKKEPAKAYLNVE